MSKQNCWEAKKCGRQPGGAKVAEFGVCPAATMTESDGFCDGKNGGRACAYVTGTFCGGTIQGTHKDKEKNCASCTFYQDIKKEHGSGLSVFKFQSHVKANTSA